MEDTVRLRLPRLRMVKVLVTGVPTRRGAKGDRGATGKVGGPCEDGDLRRDPFIARQGEVHAPT